MSDRLKRLIQKSHHHGMFGAYEIYGVQLEDEAGEQAWYVTTSDNDYRVAGGKFFSIGIHRFYNHTNDTLIQTFGSVTDIDPAEKEAILNAITKWEALDSAKRTGKETDER